MAGTRGAKARRRQPQILGAIFDRKRNALNALRLMLAIGVIFWHSFPLTGRSVEWEPLRQLLGHVWVDGFFAISGYLIVASWLNNADVVRFLTARVLRILPGFYVCLAVTAVIFAPLGILISNAGTPLYSTDSLSYVLKNALLWIFQTDIAGATAEAPYPNSINGSLWTLAWEFLCYLGVLALGITGLLKYRLTVPLCFAASWVLLLVTSIGAVDNDLLGLAARFGVAFCSGALIYGWRDRLKLSGVTVVLAALVVVASTALQEYSLVAAPFLAYFLIGTGALVQNQRFVLRNDFSYGMYVYAFPVQQLLALAGLASLPVLLFAAISAALTLPFAAISWFLVERPAMRFKPRKPIADTVGS